MREVQPFKEESLEPQNLQTYKDVAQGTYIGCLSSHDLYAPPTLLDVDHAHPTTQLYVVESVFAGMLLPKFKNPLYYLEGEIQPYKQGPPIKGHVRQVSVTYTPNLK